MIESMHRKSPPPLVRSPQEWLIRLALALNLSMAALSCTAAPAAPATSDNVNLPHGYQGDDCDEYFQSGRAFQLGNVLVSDVVYAKPWTNKRGNVSEPIKRGEKVVIGGSKNGMLCINTIKGSSNEGWISRNIIAVDKRNVEVSRKAWSGIWANSGGSWFVVSPNFDNSVTIVDGWTFDPGSKNFGGLRGLNGSSEDGRTGMAQSLLFKEPVTISARLTSQQQAILEDSACRLNAFLLPDVIVVSNQSDSCGGQGASFDGAYYRVEEYPIPSVEAGMRAILPPPTGR